MAEPKVLFLDIETLPNTVFSWGLKVDGWLPHDNIVGERHIACAAWKWLGGSKVHVATARIGKPEPDRRVLAKLHKAFEEAHAVVAHNGDFFDVPWLYTRWIALGFPPPRPIIQIDTKKLAKRYFYFNSNRLDYLGQHLGLGGKIKTDFDLWKRVYAGDRQALAEMVAYNKQDILLLEQVFLKLRPWVQSKLNAALFVEDEALASRTCPACKEPKLIRNGSNWTRTGERRLYLCKACGHRPYKLVNSDLPR